jgi:hypothetical protein
MSYALNKTLSFAALRSYVVQVLSSLEAADFTELAAEWQVQKEQVASTMASHAADQERDAVTSARVRFCNVAWGQSVRELSKKALFLAGGNSKSQPFAALFGTVKAKELQSLGSAKAITAADALLSRVAALDLPGLTAEAQELATKTEALSIAREADVEAGNRLASHAIERTQMLEQVETLIAKTEARILALHPGRNDLVRAILSPNQGRRAARKLESDEGAVGPEG